MGCLFALLAGICPRVALALIWIFTNWVDRAFDGFLIPLLGLIVFPYATLFYVLAYNPVTGGLAGWGWLFVVLGFLFDIGHWVGGGVTGRRPLRERIAVHQVTPGRHRLRGVTRDVRHVIMSQFMPAAASSAY